MYKISVYASFSVWPSYLDHPYKVFTVWPSGPAKCDTRQMRYEIVVILETFNVAHLAGTPKKRRHQYKDVTV